MSDYKAKRKEITQQSQLLFKPSVKIIRQGSNIADVISTTGSIGGNLSIKKISKTEYLNLITGEIMQYKLNSGKTIASLLKTFANMRYIINTNFTGGMSELWVTLTYAENMQDIKRLYDDLHKFFMRLKYAMPEEIKYVIVIEPQERGAWHGHIILKNVSGNAMYIHWAKLKELWPFGNASVKRLVECDNIGAYLTAYLSNAPEKENENDNIGKGLKKSLVKGKRLHFYPKNCNFFRCSRNCVKPVIEEVEYDEVLKEYGEPCFVSQWEISDEESKHTNTVTKMHFNKIRIK